MRNRTLQNSIWLLSVMLFFFWAGSGIADAAGMNLQVNVATTSASATPTPSATPAPFNPGGGGGGGGGFNPQATATPTPTGQQESVSSTRAIFSGTAYPKSKITVFKDGQQTAAAAAGNDGGFSVSVSDLAAGVYNFGLWAQDTNGLRSIAQTFAVAVATTGISVVKDIFIPPTITSDKTEVKKDGELIVSGQSAPKAQISISFQSEGKERMQSATADENGKWAYAFKASEWDTGSYTARAKAAKNNLVSTFSATVDFKIGDKDVLRQAAKCSLKADLNGDCRVNLLDFSILAYWWNRAFAESTKKIDAMLYEDGKIDLRDFSIMAYYWTS